MPFYEPRKPKQLPKYISKEKVDVVLNRARQYNPRDYLVLLTLWRTGMRCAELTNLKKKDISRDTIIIRQGKGHKDRVISADNSLTDLLALHTARLNLDDYVFGNPHKDRMSTVAIRNIVHKYQGDQRIHPHMFRHSFAVYCLKSGVNIRVLQKMLGHSNLGNTAIYLDLVADDLKTEMLKVQW